MKARRTSSEVHRDTGLHLSRIALGTVELGLDYGFRHSRHFKRPALEDAIQIVHRALDLGITLFDSARSYGKSEQVVGQALRGMRERVILVSKITVPPDALTARGRKPLRDMIVGSIDASLDALQTDVIDIMMLHNTSLALLDHDDVLLSLERAREKGKLRFLGASCSSEELAFAALGNNAFQLLEVPFNILDRRMLLRVLPKAAERGIAVLARSIFLRGVLTSNIAETPDRLSSLKAAALQALEESKNAVRSLSELALRFPLAFDAISSLIIGVRTVAELESNMADFAKGKLSPELVSRLCAIDVPDPLLLNTQDWQDLI